MNVERIHRRGAPHSPAAPDPAGSAASSGREIPFLQKADAARKGRGVWRGTAIGSGIGLTLALVPFVLLLIVIGPNLLVLFPGLLFNGLFAAMLWVSLGRARQRGREIAPAIDAAWLAAAGDLARRSWPQVVVMQSRLRDFTFDKVKIDRSFVLDIDREPAAARMLESIVSLCNALNMRIVAEGVETRQQAEALSAMGVHEFQGYHFARPMAGDVWLQWLRDLDGRPPLLPRPPDPPASRPPG